VIDLKFPLLAVDCLLHLPYVFGLLELDDLLSMIILRVLIDLLIQDFVNRRRKEYHADTIQEQVKD
jgi:hypothetical protein